jgi:hypothetical protein
MLKMPLILVALGLTGCASPLVQYVLITESDDHGYAKFELAESVINFKYGKTQSGVPTSEIIITSVPIPSGTKRYGIAGTSFYENWGAETNVNVAFRDDSPLIQEVAIDVTDRGQQALQALGGATAAFASLLSLSPEPTAQKLPTGISIANFLNSIPDGCANAAIGLTTAQASPKTVYRDQRIVCTNVKLEGTDDFTADIVLSARPVDAIAVETLDKPIKSHNFLYAACRSFTITLKGAKGNQNPVSATVAVADPNWLQTIRFPVKGKITSASSCGASATSQSASLPTAFDYLNTLATQAKAVKEALAGKSGVKK